MTLLEAFDETFDITPGANVVASTVMDEVQHLRDQMQLHEIREAENLAEEIIESNQNCCLNWPDHYFGND